MPKGNHQASPGPSPSAASSPPTQASGEEIGVSVPDSETVTEDKKKHFTVYKVLVQVPGKSWFIFRRYNEFHTLMDKLKKPYPDLNLKLPGKNIFETKFLKKNLNPEFIKARREGLHDFITQLLQVPNIINNPDVREFLSLDHPKNAPVKIDEVEEAANEGTEGKVDELSKDLEKVDLGESLNEKAKPSDFEFLKVIGKGSFGKVLLAKHKQDGKHYAIKVLRKAAIRKRNEARHIMAERNVLLKNVKHPFLVGLQYSFQTHDKLYFVLDYVNGGELFFHLQKERYFPEHRARFYAAEIASAIGYLHGLGIIYSMKADAGFMTAVRLKFFEAHYLQDYQGHMRLFSSKILSSNTAVIRDLKPENILLDSKGHVKLTDFGLCKEGIEPLGTTSTFCGTPEYLAPEVLRKQDYDKSVDWWCLGAVTYEMMYGLPPFYSRDTAEMYDMILHKPLRLRTNISHSARDLLQGLLQKDRTKRLGASENDFEDIRVHPFFRTINWQDLYDKKIEPPYNPNVKDQMDLKHFDPEFVRESVPESLKKQADHQISASVGDPDDAFVGFTYVPPTDELQE